MRLADPFRDAGWWFLVAERHFDLQCTCGVKQTVEDLRKRVSGKVTLYECPQCRTALVGIAEDDWVRPQHSDPIDLPPHEDGHRMCGFVFGSKVDMLLSPPGSDENSLHIPARPRFFSARGCE